MSGNRQSGFSILELIIVLAIGLVVAAMALPKLQQSIDAQRLQMAAQDYAVLMQEARARAVQDNTWYEVQNGIAGSTLIGYVDLNGNSTYDAGEPMVQLPRQITITDAGAPRGFDTPALLGRVPLNLETTPPMLNAQNVASPGIAFNERGLPCQRSVAGGNCTNSTTILVGGTPQTVPVAWVTYFKYSLSNGGTAWAAITATPAGRIKAWKYQGGVWN